MNLPSLLKRLLDLFISFTFLLTLSPLLLVIALSISLDSPGGVFFLQKRIGFKGKIFTIYKFRSMIADAEAAGTGLFSSASDPRITRVGHFLRETSLDELPQLINVFLGSMSLVGPRPPVTYELGPLSDYTPLMLKRFDVMPGITGLAQVCGRNSLNWDQKIAYDNRYVDLYSKYGIIIDIYILMRTLHVIIARANISEDLSKPVEGPVSSKAFTSGNPASNLFTPKDLD